MKRGILSAAVAAAAVAGVYTAARTFPAPPEAARASDPEHAGSVVGDWVSSWPSEGGHMVVVVRGRDGSRVACHFEEVSAADRIALETRLVRSGEVTICGRRDGVEDGVAILRGCSLLD